MNNRIFWVSSSITIAASVIAACIGLLGSYGLYDLVSDGFNDLMRYIYLGLITVGAVSFSVACVELCEGFGSYDK
jgi:ABC-type spermidine/putrescine transport system permease subunit II